MRQLRLYSFTEMHENIRATIVSFIKPYFLFASNHLTFLAITFPMLALLVGVRALSQLTS
ncbi:hypothetical protein GGD54_006413 [Rhizobium tropici]|uniref:Uncharacterized protein n=1 Tax=Rhizobium tropici TaxID=398 RepID=A0ABR6R9T3_RHITR|nr:hypothetical protein [Rhizobium tropici]MBB5596888.1 hypothetical protein [Rhizobium tropici]MBB6495945.1 hypothetical protein [Rhizobium tropici]